MEDRGSRIGESRIEDWRIEDWRMEDRGLGNRGLEDGESRIGGLRVEEGESDPVLSHLGSKASSATKHNGGTSHAQEAESRNQAEWNNKKI